LRTARLTVLSTGSNSNRRQTTSPVRQPGAAAVRSKAEDERRSREQSVRAHHDYLASFGVSLPQQPYRRERSRPSRTAATNSSVLTLIFTPGTSKGEDFDFGAGDKRNIAPSRSASSKTAAKFSRASEYVYASRGRHLQDLEFETSCPFLQDVVQAKDRGSLIDRARDHIGIVCVDIDRQLT
jgi:hypothetical protein